MAIRRLRFREQPESLRSEVRPRRHAGIRFVYFTIIIMLAMWLVHVFLGGFFYLRSEGRVLGEEAVVAVEFPATVRQIRVDVGAHVTAGQIVAVISSQNVTDGLARLSSEQADRALRLGEMRIRSQTVNAVIGLARTREAVATDTRHKLESLLPSGFLPLDRRTAALESEFRSRQDLAQLSAEQGAMAGQIAGLTQAAATADDAIDKLRHLYDDGVLRSPIDGIVGRRLVEAGSVLGPGQPLLAVYKDARFVEAFLPTGGLFTLAVGDRIVASTGMQNFTGSIERIEPVAEVLPGEFRRAFAPMEREQLIRIAFDPAQSAPLLFTKVEIRSAFYWPWRSRPARGSN